VIISYFGHAAAAIESRGGMRILFDPYQPGAFDNRLRYEPIPGEYDVVVISHEHLDHNHVAPGFGRPAVVRRPTSVRGIDIRMFPARHGDNQGTMETTTRVTLMLVDDLRIVHCGDLGPPVGEDLVANLRNPDLLFVPVGGRFTLDPEEAADFVRRVAPRAAIPIHYRTRHMDLPLRPVDDFLTLVPSVRRFSSGPLEVLSGMLPIRTEVWVLPPQCGG